MTAPGVCIGIGPANFAGQADAWARAIRVRGGVSAFSFANASLPARLERRPGWQFSVDRRIPHHRLTVPGLRRWAVNHRLGRELTHLCIDGFLSLYRRQDRPLERSEIAELSRRYAGVGIISHGTDTRDPEIHMQRLPESYFKLWGPQQRRAVAARAAHNRALAEQHRGPVFVSTPDLLIDLPGARWLPVVVEPDQWRAGVPAELRRRPRVLHLPSQRKPPIKGTRDIDEILTRMDEQGLVEYVSPHSVPHHLVPGLVGSVDIVIDQIRSGFYGVAAVEAMAVGRLVIGHVAEDVRNLMPEPPPIVDATPTTLQSVLDEVLEAPERLVHAAASGPAFVQRWHDGAASALALAAGLNLAGTD